MKVELTDEELVFLDGKVSSDTQKEVDNARERIAMVKAIPDLDPKHAKFIADVVREAQTNGELVRYHENIRHCSLCDANAGYDVHRRRGRYHRVGQPNYDKPITMSGVELARRVIRITGYVALGCCRVCFDKLLPDLQKALTGVKAEMPKSLTGVPPKWKRWNKRRCQCGWEGHEGEMGQLLTFMGDGFYRGKCPKCGEENSLFSQRIKPIEGFVVVAAVPQ